MRIPAFIPGTTGELAADELKLPILMPFPFGGELAATLDSEAAHTWFPKQLTINKCVEWYWRVESWMLSISISGQGGISASQQILLRCRPKADTDERTITDSTMAPFSSYSDDETAVNSIDFTSGGYDWRIFETTFYLLNSDSFARRRYQLQESSFPPDLMMPTIGVSMGIFYRETGSGAGEYTYGGNTFTELNTGADYIMADCTVGADNEVLLYLPLYWDGLIPDGERLTSVSVSIIPYRYWPYAKASGLEPIWDDTTGEQLRNVITGELL